MSIRENWTTWESPNGKWKVSLHKDGTQMNIHEKRSPMLTHVHLVRVIRVVEGFGKVHLTLQDNPHSKRIPKYVLQEAEGLCY